VKLDDADWEGTVVHLPAALIEPHGDGPAHR